MFYNGNVLLCDASLVDPLLPHALDLQELPCAVSKHAVGSEEVVELMAVGLAERKTIPEAVVAVAKLMVVGTAEGKTIPEAVVAVAKLMAVGLAERKTNHEAVAELMVDTAKKTNLNIQTRYATQESAEPQARKNVCVL
ncbi:hypothetical protein ROHU_010363 [Labeo rohita]|uniref:Uncharacterized protein n=1 Tax=Labeo rohita TaxID=84645 RepID=A0A498LYC8_LABRO|nr:hypothetical protein ROHU_010363 [Labeo rohita]